MCLKAPLYETFEITGPNLSRILSNNNLIAPFGPLDNLYYYTNREGWANLLPDLMFASWLYKADKFDCENYALKAMVIAAERFGLNAFGVAIGEMPQGRHGFNIFYTGDSLMLLEPNNGYAWAGVFEIGDNGYKPEMVLI